MIAYLKGKLAHAQAGYIIIDVGGIGYKVQAPLSLQDSLPPRGGEIMLYTHLVVREDGFYLYGFQEQSELESFLKLLGVPGVGPKGALAALTILSPDELWMAIAGADAATLTRVPGIGKKTAGRIILELKDKAPQVDVEQGAGREGGGRVNDAIMALESLGYSSLEARRAVKEAEGTANNLLTAEELIKNALRHLIKK
ncbi:MAG: Holliday junction branch migration protein RuvA [Desulfotomaculaceae bacterium]|nr:Holliday junction branch migration protein RuvA [Desulfotomaculaceae bacterium]